MRDAIGQYLVRLHDLGVTDKVLAGHQTSS
jgi:hypothetical protein